MRRPHALLIGLALTGPLFFPGCGGTNERSGTIKDQGKLGIEDLGQFLKGLPSDGKKPPTKMAELVPLEPMVPVAGDMIKAGTIVYYWGHGYFESSKSVVAFEKKVDTEGGWVLLQDGTVKKMTADEFKAAPKAKK